MVATQRKLDEESERYLKGVQDKNHIPPAVFRIPKVSASMKLAMTETSKRKLSVILVSASSEAKKMNQQSIDFEIAASPPPAELVQALQTRTPRAELLLAPTERKSIRDVLARLEFGGRDTLISADHWDRALIWPFDLFKLSAAVRKALRDQDGLAIAGDLSNDTSHREETDFVANVQAKVKAKFDRELRDDERDAILARARSQQFLFMLARAPGKQNTHKPINSKHLVGVWQLTLDPLNMEPLIVMQQSVAEELDPLRNFVYVLGQQQAKFLRGL